MPNDEYTGEDETMPSKEEWTFTRDGFDFTGFKFENEGELLNGSQEYVDTLLEDEDRKITLYAQWKPWIYTITYNPNGGYGDMPDDIFDYFDEEMESDPNKFVRDGYSFEGFAYEDENGNVTIYKNINDFRSEFMKLGKNSVIELVAQWKKLPDTNTYVAPVTGVE